MAASEHAPGGELREREDAGQINLKDFLPLGERMVLGRFAVDGAGVVDEDVDLREAGRDLIEEMLCAGGIGKISGKRSCSAADRFDVRGSFCGRAAIAVAGKGGACLCKCNGHGGAEPGGCAGDERGEAVEAEHVVHVWVLCHIAARIHTAGLSANAPVHRGKLSSGPHQKRIAAVISYGFLLSTTISYCYAPKHPSILT